MLRPRMTKAIRTTSTRRSCWVSDWERIRFLCAREWEAIFPGTGRQRRSGNARSRDGVPPANHSVGGIFPNGPANDGSTTYRPEASGLIASSAE
jgi:hypothetical protein